MVAIRCILTAWFSFFASMAFAAENIKTVGASGADYTTISAWEADLDDGTGAALNTTAYGSGDDAILELIDASYSEGFVTLNGGSSVGLNSITIRPASGNKHDGTFDSGCEWNIAALQRALYITGSVDVTIEDMEFHSDLVSGNYACNDIIWHKASTCDMTVQRCLFRCDGGDRTSGGTCAAIKVDSVSAGTVNVLNNVITGFTRGSGASGWGLYFTYAANVNCMNNTVTECYVGIDNNQAGGTRVAKNNIACHCGSADWANTGNWDTNSTNYSEDATNGTDTNQSLASLFVGSGDYTPKSGSDLIGNGADLVTTPTGVNIDAAQRDRDSNGDTWDVGALQTVSSGIILDPIVLPGTGPIIIR